MSRMLTNCRIWHQNPFSVLCQNSYKKLTDCAVFTQVSKTEFKKKFRKFFNVFCNEEYCAKGDDQSPQMQFSPQPRSVRYL